MAAKKSGSGKTPPKGPGYSTSTKGNSTQVQKQYPKTGNAGLRNAEPSGKTKKNADGSNRAWDTMAKKGPLTGSRASSVALSNKMSKTSPAAKAATARTKRK